MTEEPILFRLIETVRESRERTAAYFPLALMAETCQYFENKFMPQAEVGA